MGKRILSAIILLLLFIPVILIGGNIFNLVIYIFSLCAFYEFIGVKDSKKEVPLFIKMIGYVALSCLVFSNQNSNAVFLIDYRVLTGILILFLIPTVLYHNKAIYSVNDAFYMIGSVLFLGISFSLMILIRRVSLIFTVYLFLISIFSDTYAYITGSYIGKHKLLEPISPDKTLEGMIGGILFGVFVPVMFFTINSDINVFLLIFVTLFLCILGIFGDLCFSAIKRYFGKKDFSSIILGHGGVLDRFDSIIFIVLGFMFFINIMGG